MGLEYICDTCKAPMCAFKTRYDGSRECMHCARREREAGASISVRIHKALGVLVAQHRGYILDAKLRIVPGSFGHGLKAKTKALVRHDRILREES